MEISTLTFTEPIWDFIENKPKFKDYNLKLKNKEIGSLSQCKDTLFFNNYVFFLS
jgi:hypothetical protein